MKRGFVLRNYSNRFNVLLGGLLVGLVFVSPLSAIAFTANPLQIIPPGGGKTCAPISTSGLHPYVYSGNLDSFDVTISDFRYVAVSASVGNTQIPLTRMTRWLTGGEGIRTHFDIYSTQTQKGVPVQVVFLSVQTVNNVSVTCLYSISGTVQGSSFNQIGEGNVQYPSLGNIAEQNLHKTPSKPAPKPVKPTKPDNSTSSTSIKNAGIVGASNALGALCSTGGGAKLWFVLLVLYTAFVVLLSFQKFEAPTVKEWNIVLILGVFLGLLVFWYMSALCRAGFWTPILATLIATGGVIYTAIQPVVSADTLLLKPGEADESK